MIHVKTSAGFEADISESVRDNIELLDALADLEGGNALALSRVVQQVMGDAKKSLYDFCRGEDGVAPTTAVSEQLMEIIQQVGGKNS
jgi:hypothetical protein